VEEYDYSKKSNDWLMGVLTGEKPKSPKHMAANRELEKRAHAKWRKRLLIKVSVIVIVGAALLLGRYFLSK
jgi:hypothetical protein